MDWVELFTAIIAFTGLFALLGGLNWLVIRLSLRAIEKDINHIKQDLSNHITELKAGQANLDKKFDDLKNILLRSKLADKIDN